MDRLATAVRALEEWAVEHQVVIDPTRKSAIIAFLYDYLEKGAQERDLATVFRGMER